MTKVINRWAAGIKPNPLIMKRFEILFFPKESIVKFKHCFNSIRKCFRRQYFKSYVLTRQISAL